MRRSNDEVTWPWVGALLIGLTLGNLSFHAVVWLCWWRFGE